jgi:hemoglobin
MKAQHKKQKAFVSAALGSPVPYTYRDMRKAHEDLDIKESDFNAIAEHLQITLQELKVKDEYIKQIIAIVATTKDDVLNRKKSDK